MRIWFTLLILLTVALGAREFDAAATQAGVANAAGQVEKQIHGGPWQKCAVGDLLTTGDRIRTGAESSASLLLVDKTVMRLGAGTTITLIDLSETDSQKLVRKFEQQGGRSWSDVTPNPANPTTYEVHGPNAVAAVKGTSFEVDAETAEADIRCWEGEVECRTDGQTFAVPANRSLKARKGAPLLASFDPNGNLDDFQRGNLAIRAQERAYLSKMPQRIKLQAETLRSFGRTIRPTFGPRLQPRSTPNRPRGQRRPR